MTSTIVRPARNGVDVPTLFATLDAVAAQPELAQFQFRARNTWLSGTHSRSEIDGFYGAGVEDTTRLEAFTFDADHPAVLVGGGAGVTPIEFLLHAVAACLSAGLANIAAARGITLRRVSSTVEGDIDLLGILGLFPDVRNGYRQIRVAFEIEGDATAEQLTELVEQSRRRSAVYDVLTNGTDVVVDVTVREPALGVRGGAVPHIPLAVIGAGQAGLAVSRLLGDAGVEHVILERGRVAERWRARRHWRSLRLLTPNWMTRLPGWSYGGPDPDGYMTAGEVAGFLGGYAGSLAAPVVEHAEVRSVRRVADGYRVVTGVGTWSTDAVVLATGWSDLPRVPDLAVNLDRGLHQLTPDRYRDPSELPEGGVLIVGASATGVQLADELARAGRRVVVSAGRHSRLPRRYRGIDIMRWLDALGVNRRDLDHVPDPAAVLREPSLQLAGRPDHRDVHLAALQALGVQVVGRLTGVDGNRVAFAADLPGTTTAADVRLRRLLARIDAHADGSPGPIQAQVQPVVTAGAVPDLNLRATGIRTVVWATGYRRAYPWLQVPVLDSAGDVRHHRGRTPAPGLFVVGMNWQSHRGSMTLDGVGHDAAHVAAQAIAHLGCGSGQRVASNPHWDVVVVGARVAGSATAMLLARVGLRVLVVDRARRGADTVSTHALMRGGVRQLQRWGLLDALIAAGTPPVRRILFHYGEDAVPVTVRPEAGVDALYAPRRPLLDTLLADAAVHAGARVSYGSTVIGLLRDGNRVTGVQLRDRASGIRAERAGLVIGADGRRSTVAAAVGAQTLVAGSRAGRVRYRYWRHLDADGYEWFYDSGRAAGVIPTNDGLSCVFLGSSEPHPGGGDIPWPDPPPRLARRLAHAEPVGGERIVPGQPGFLKQAWGPGWALVGDAGHWKDPLSTHGITAALRDAELLADAVTTTPEPGPRQHEALAHYQELRDRLSLPMMKIVEQIAAYEWDLPEVQHLLGALASAMNNEVDELAALPAAA